MKSVRDHFPQLMSSTNQITYLDSAATTLKPQSVIDSLIQHYSFGVSNVHRGAHTWSDRATQDFELTRQAVAQFLGSAPEEIVFTRGTTESINLVASSFGERLNSGDEILLSQMEHHSNIVPWQLLSEKKGLTIKYIPVTDHGDLDLARLPEVLTAKTKVVSVVYVSNALGTINDVQKLISAARSVRAMVLLDAAQAVSILPIDVKKLDCDFLTFSGHKLFGPTGVGVLYGKLNVLNSMPPYQGGGSMISEVFEERSTFLDSPHRFEAGTPAIGEVVALRSAIEFVKGLGFSEIQKHEQELVAAADEQLRKISGVKIFSQAKSKANVVSFNLEGSHPSDVGAILNQQNLAVRAGHHCCQPLMRKFGIPGTVRASFSIYNTIDDVKLLTNAVKKAVEILR